MVAVEEKHDKAAKGGDSDLTPNPLNDDPYLLLGTESSLGDPCGTVYYLPGVVVGLVVVGVVDHLGYFGIEIYIDPEARTTSPNCSFHLNPSLSQTC